MSGRSRLSREEAAWTMTEAANEPYFNLIQRYVFAPFFTGTLAATQAEGASAWGLVIGAAGVAIAVLAPTLGSIADSGARKKPWVLAFMALTILSCASLWFAAPGVPLWPVMLAVFAATIAAEILAVFTNAFLPQVAPVSRAGLLSGINFGISQLAGIAVLLVVLGVGKAGWLADIPGGLDRMSGPLAAAATLLFLIPFLLVVRDPPSEKRGSVGQGLADLKATLAEAWREPDMRWFLVGRMFGQDGMAVIFAFGAVLAGASFGWTAGTLAVFGITITVFGAAGGFLAGWLDSRLGAKRLVILGFALVFLGALSVLLTDERRLFGVPTGAPLGAPLSTPQEYGFLASGAVIAVGAAFAISAMRALLATLAPPHKIAAYFGLYAFVGKATAFVGPFLVSAVSYATGSVRMGVLVSLVFLVVGSLAMARVRSPKGVAG